MRTEGGGDPEFDEACEIAAAMAGDADAYRRLVRRHQSTICQQMQRFARDPAVRDELTHDVFVEAYLGLRGYRGTAPWIHWLRKIAVRVGYRHWTKRRTQAREIELTDEDWRRLRGQLPEPSDAGDAAELIYSLFAQLSPSDRLILTLIHLDGCTMAEAADRAGWSIVGARVRAFRARRRLGKLIEEQRNEE